MSISFSLELTPKQIDFLQRLDLYASGALKCILDVEPDQFNGSTTHFHQNIRKLIREGLVIHTDLPPGVKHSEKTADHRFYQITEKGQAVLAMIDDDVHRFIAKQDEIKELRKKAARRRA